MREPLHPDEFEDFLQDQVKNHRMYAADGAWRNIQKTLHGERGWPALTFVFIFIIGALTAGTLLTKPNTNLLQSQYHPASQASIAIAEKDENTSTEKLSQHINPDNISRRVTASYLGFKSNDIDSQNMTSLSLLNTDVAFQNTNAEAIEENIIRKEVVPNNVATLIKQEPEITAQTEEKSDDILFTTPSSFSFMSPINANNTRKFFMQSSVLSSQKYTFRAVKHLSASWASFPGYNFFNQIKKTSRFSYQLYFTPSVSYRNLRDVNSGKSPQNFISGLPASANYSIDVNKLVHNVPSLGMEAGVAFGYSIKPNLIVKTGVQFNVREYNIIAYANSKPSSLGGITNSNLTSADSSSSSLSTSSTNTSKEVILNDRYYEIAIPIGIDWKLATFNKISFGIAGSLQPTYTFDKQPFIITSDFKSYTNGSSLMRNWNINSSVDAYLSYEMGTYTWQVGPQFRYQTLPTFQYSYPVREHLLDYGLKIGITRSLKY